MTVTRPDQTSFPLVGRLGAAAPVRSHTARWIVVVLLSALLGGAAGYGLGRESGPAPRAAQPIIDALAKPVPEPLDGKVLWQDSFAHGFLGPDQRNQVTVEHGQSIAIDISNARDSGAVERIMKFYEDYYASATGTSWGGSSGNPNYNLIYQRSDGTYREEGLLQGWHVDFQSQDNELHIDAAILDFPKESDRSSITPTEVRNMLEPTTGTRVLWLRCRVRVHELSGPAKVR